MSLLDRLRRTAVPPADALYRAVVAEARQPGWFTDGGVPDSIDGRFDMVALVLSLVLLRLEHDGGAAAQLSADVTERFVADMDGSLRQMGIGDPTVGKQVGGMVSALGGRIGAYREAGADDAALTAALERNLWRGMTPDAAAREWAVAQVRALQARLAGLSLDAIAGGRL